MKFEFVKGLTNIKVEKKTLFFKLRKLLAESTERNNIIVDLVSTLKGNIAIIVDFTEHQNTLKALLESKGIPVTIMRCSGTTESDKNNEDLNVTIFTKNLFLNKHFKFDYAISTIYSQDSHLISASLNCSCEAFVQILDKIPTINVVTKLVDKLIYNNYLKINYTALENILEEFDEIEKEMAA